VVGSGPNGLTAAIVLQRAGFATTVYEANDTIGGGTRSAELTLPGYHHDVCSAIHPLAAASPVFASFPLQEHGLEWIQPPIPVAHPLDHGPAAVLLRDLHATCVRLGVDGSQYRRAVAPLLRQWNDLLPELLGPPLHVPVHPPLMTEFASLAMWPAATMAWRMFETRPGRALFAGIAAHSVMPLEKVGSGAFAWVLAIAAHAVGWPLPRGGSQSIGNALASYFQSLGGRISVNSRIQSLDELGQVRPLLFDVTPRQLVEIAGERMPESFRRELLRFRYGPGAFKVDWALRAPIPWKCPECSQAGTVHLGGTLAEIAASERLAATGLAPDDPMVLLTQPTQFDPSRAPAGGHIAWAYCHVPNGSKVDMTERIEAQVERFAPGFSSNIAARHVTTPADFEERNANLIGGDIMGGAHTLRQLAFRPTRMYYRTAIPGVYLCSSSTPPGGGVHGMCGYHAAQAVLGDLR
jgi:phytoene dehydrogenase-like protein